MTPGQAQKLLDYAKGKHAYFRDYYEFTKSFKNYALRIGLPEFEIERSGAFVHFDKKQCVDASVLEQLAQRPSLGVRVIGAVG